MSNFMLVLGTPIVVQKVHDMSRCGGWRRGPGPDDRVREEGEEGQGPWSWYHGLTQASQGPGSMLVQLSSSHRGHRQRRSMSEVHRETTNLIQLPSSVSCEMRGPPYTSGRTELLWYSESPSEMPRPSYAPCGTELPWYSTLNLKLHLLLCPRARRGSTGLTGDNEQDSTGIVREP